MKNHSSTITLAQKKDFDVLFALWKRVGLELFDKQSEYKELLMMLRLNPTSCFIAKHNGNIIGSVFGVFNGRRAWIYHLAVHPVWQKLGIGSKLLKQAEQALSNLGGVKVRLWVEFTNLKVMPFYEKHGYQVISDAIMLGKTVKKRFR